MTFDGYNIVAASVEEIIAPGVYLPRAVPIAMCVLLVLYLSFTLAFGLVMGAQTIDSTNTIQVSNREKHTFQGETFLFACKNSSRSHSQFLALEATSFCLLFACVYSAP